MMIIKRVAYSQGSDGSLPETFIFKAFFIYNGKSIELDAPNIDMFRKKVQSHT